MVPFDLLSAWDASPEKHVSESDMVSKVPELEGQIQAEDDKMEYKGSFIYSLQSRARLSLLIDQNQIY